LYEERTAARFHSARRVPEVHDRLRRPDGSVPQGIRRDSVNRDLTLGCVTLALAAAYYAAAALLPQSQLDDAVGPGGLPKTYAVVLAVLSLALIAQSLRRRQKDAARRVRKDPPYGLTTARRA